MAASPTALTRLLTIFTMAATAGKGGWVAQRKETKGFVPHSAARPPSPPAAPALLPRRPGRPFYAQRRAAPRMRGARPAPAAPRAPPPMAPPGLGVARGPLRGPGGGGGRALPQPRPRDSAVLPAARESRQHRRKKGKPRKAGKVLCNDEQEVLGLPPPRPPRSSSV